MRPIAHHSASSVALWVECTRKWVHRYVIGDFPPPTPAMLRGTAIHKDIEAFQLGHKTLEELENGNLIVPALEYFPKRGPDILIEHRFEVPTLLGCLPFMGFIDIVDASNPLSEEILDTKTTSDFRYAKTAFELAENIQLLAYAWYRMDVARRALQLEPLEMIQISHVYIRTKGKPSARKVTAMVTYDHVKRFWYDVILKHVREIETQIASGSTDANEAAPNTASCGLFGGCAFRPQCGFIDTQQETLTVDDYSWIERLRAAKAALNLGTATVETSTTPFPEDVVAPVLPPDAPPRFEPGTIVCRFDEAAVTPPVPEAAAKPAKGKKAKAVLDAPPPGTPSAKPWPSPVIYVDCYPVKGPQVTLAETILAVVMAECAIENNVYDHRAIAYEAKARLANSLRRYIDKNGLPPVIVVSSYSTGYDTLMEVLTPFASQIVKSVRG